mmetsp:Transcript_4577/g.11000  ORF Transcript_4577/g.11000 Transcript_4577/m.11000 type:complete len:259 (-) Transcript_4577:339-1115(-)
MPTAANLMDRPTPQVWKLMPSIWASSSVRGELPRKTVYPRSSRLFISAWMSSSHSSRSSDDTRWADFMPPRELIPVERWVMERTFRPAYSDRSCDVMPSADIMRWYGVRSSVFEPSLKTKLPEKPSLCATMAFTSVLPSPSPVALPSGDPYRILMLPKASSVMAAFRRAPNKSDSFKNSKLGSVFSRVGSTPPSSSSLRANQLPAAGVLYPTCPTYLPLCSNCFKRLAWLGQPVKAKGRRAVDQMPTPMGRPTLPDPG